MYLGKSNSYNVNYNDLEDDNYEKEVNFIIEGYITKTHSERKQNFQDKNDE